MNKSFSESEKHILKLFSVGTKFKDQATQYTVVNSGKPTCMKGEPKTDIYISAISNNNELKEYKISFKKKNADFLENKIGAERAQQLFGDSWQEIIYSAIKDHIDEFRARPLIYKTRGKRTEQGSITLGWKFELLIRKSGQLSGNMNLTRSQVLDVYAGTNISEDKRDAYVKNKIIPNSGIANYILFENSDINTAQQAIDELITVNDFATMHPSIYFACKALNYRTFKNRFDGNRPLAVYIDWFISREKLAYKINFDQPLAHGGNEIKDNLINALRCIGAESTDDLSDMNVLNTQCIH
ncbi:hypothetical protein [Alloscardovia omnicolens]|uniref:hypothetical protein n=1 Tax=Alloscardovia omnicolens TaxID=419015 RepID=UPI00242AE47B|nr:hypothetical protein [Alloscardovia omnicolens]MBS6346369.1 hypothetical protein [Alloscardovia omnicolens]